MLGVRATTATAWSVEVTVFGQGSHGSMPHLGVDPVVLCSSIVLRLQTLVAREIAPGDFGVVTVGSMQAGGSANVIPDSAQLQEAFVGRFGAAAVHEMSPQTASEDFSLVPRALGAPSVYWGFGGFTAGREPVANHNPGFAPDAQPTLHTGTEALVAAAGAWFVG